MENCQLTTHADSQWGCYYMEYCICSLPVSACNILTLLLYRMVWLLCLMLSLAVTLHCHSLPKFFLKSSRNVMLWWKWDMLPYSKDVHCAVYHFQHCAVVVVIPEEEDTLTATSSHTCLTSGIFGGLLLLSWMVCSRAYTLYTSESIS